MPEKKKSCESAGFLIWAVFESSDSFPPTRSLLGFSDHNDWVKVGEWWATPSGRNLVIWGLEDNGKDISHWMWAWEDATFAAPSPEMFEHKVNCLSKLWELVMDMETWRVAVHRVTKSQTWLSDWNELTWTSLHLRKQEFSSTLERPRLYFRCWSIGKGS